MLLSTISIITVLLVTRSLSVPVPTSDELNEYEKKINDLEKLASECDSTENCVSEWLNQTDAFMSIVYEKNMLLTYQFETNITDETEAELNEFYSISSLFSKTFKFWATKFNSSSQNFTPPIKRMLHLASMGVTNKEKKDLEELSKFSNELRAIYARARVVIDKKAYSLEPGLTQLLRTSRNYTLLKSAWLGWHRESGARMRHTFTNTVRLNNKAARESGYADLSESWIEEFEDEDLENVMNSLLDEIKPLYEQVHAYVRRRLVANYGRHYPSHHNPHLIPAHLFGNMWSQDWSNIYDLLEPFPDATSTDLTELLVKNNYTVVEMFKESERFFTSLGLFNMTEEFWTNSMIEKPVDNDREVDCHGSAFDFYNGHDFRIKMCTEIDDNYFRTVHHEMGHVEYFMAYKNQPVIFRSGANSGFHEAIGDTIALSLLTDTHLKNIGFINEVKTSQEQTINFLMKIALKKLVSLPYTYLVDKWRWDVFRGRINETNYNSEWWKLIEKYQGIEPPTRRSEKDFDAGGKYHIPNYTPYARYFMSNILQFQFFQAMCRLSNHNGPLHTCDFYGSKTAGAHLKEMLELGASKHWRDALFVLTGDRIVKSDAIREYFQPLYEWLKLENDQYDLKPGF